MARKALIFLDVDGVLNSIRSCIGFNSSAVWDPVSVSLLNNLCLDLFDKDITAEIVISSTWRMMYKKLEWWNKAFKTYEAHAVKVIGMTPCLNDNKESRRGREINIWMAQYLEANDSTPFVCIDDDNDFLPHQPLVKTTWQYGLCPEHVGEAYKVLTGEDHPKLTKLNA